MLEFTGFKVENRENPKFTSIKFDFTDSNIVEVTIEDLSEKLHEYEMYLEYDTRCEFSLEYKKNRFILEMIITLPSRKVPEEKKELEDLVAMHVMDFNEYYHKISNLNNLHEDDLVEHIYKRIPRKT